MSKENKEMLDGAIRTGIEELIFLESGSDEKQKEVENLTKLYKLQIEEEKNEKELEETRKKNFADKVKAGAEIGVTLISLGVGCYWTKKSFKFEETGTITSTAGRSFINRMLKLIGK